MYLHLSCNTVYVQYSVYVYMYTVPSPTRFLHYPIQCTLNLIKIFEYEGYKCMLELLHSNITEQHQALVGHVAALHLKSD